MKLTVLGCGDAFGSGGRLQTSFHLAAAEGELLIDCGATALIGLQRSGLSPSTVDQIVISHLHGDHFSGLVWWMLHAVHVDRRTRPLVVAGPAGIEQRFRLATNALFPGALDRGYRFDLSFQEMQAGRRDMIGRFAATPFEVIHPSGAPSHALRIESEGKVVAFSGDTEWVETLVPCAERADLFICECYGYETATRHHLTWLRLAQELPRIAAHRVMLTHMNLDMLARVEEVARAGMIVSRDGLVVEV
jgi:ribonuclease BN (tRNA processing enzyme)